MFEIFLNAMALLINKALEHDVEATVRLEKLEGTCIQIEMSGLTVYLFFDAGEIHLSPEYIGDPLTSIKGPIGAFMHLALAKNPREAANLGLRIEGNISVGESLQSLFLHLDIDWEEWLSHWTGDTIAYQVGAVVRSSKQKGHEILKSVSQHSSRYIEEDARLVPTAIETEVFLKDVDTLRSDMDRLDARLKVLETHLFNS